MITTETVESAYEFLRTLSPMKGWKLPHADEIEFKVVSRGTDFGVYTAYPHRITINTKRHGHLHTFLATLSHEMLHLHLSLKNLDAGQDPHGEAFQKHAARICRALGFDPKAF